MGMLARFWNWLKTPAKEKTGKGHPDLYPIDVDKLAKELNLVEEASRLGEAGLPSSDAKVLSGPEAAIIQRVEKARQDYVDWAVLRLNVLSQDLGRKNVTQEVNRASQADKEFERKAAALLTEQDSLLRNLGNTAKRRKAELENFKAKNGLSHDADYPTTTRTYFRYAFLLLLIVVEGMLNASFFAQGLDTGLLGGFSQAVILAATNVLIAFAFGKFAIRYLNHSSPAWKILGFFSLVTTLTVMGSLGLGIAHYRDSLTAELADPARATLQAMVANPFQLRDIFSWALFAISISFGIASMFDGLWSDDLYPGYGSITRRTQIAMEDHEDELNTVQMTLEELKNEELTFLDRTVQQSQVSLAVFESLVDDKLMAGSRLSTALRDADNSMTALLGKFRTENELHRKGVMRPKYFDRHPDLQPIHIPDFNTEADKATLVEQRELVKSLLANVQEIRARIQAAFNQQFDRLKPLDIHFPSKAVN